MRFIVNGITGTVLALSLMTAACGGDDEGASCAKVVDHTLTLVPAELAEQMGSKDELIKSCEERTDVEGRECALKAKTMEDLSKCPRKDS